MFLAANPSIINTYQHNISMATLSDRNLPLERTNHVGTFIFPDISVPTTLERRQSNVKVDIDRRLDSSLKQEAVKFDKDKLDWSLLPFEALEGTVKVLQFGANKYARSNWKIGGGFKYTRTISACLRHLFAYMRGQDLDPESGLSHIDHAMCNLVFLAYFIRNKRVYNKDDRELNV